MRTGKFTLAIVWFVSLFALGAGPSNNDAKPKEKETLPAKKEAKTAAPEGEKVASNKTTKEATTAKTETKTEEISEEQADAEKSELDKKQIRKILSSQPDPSMVLEPIPEEPKKAAVKAVKAPPKPPTRPTNKQNELSIAGGGTGNPTGGNNPLAGGTRGLAGQRFGRTASEAPASPEVAVILVGRVFYPARIRLRDGVQTRVYFTTTNDRAAAVVIEQLQVQRWVAKEKAAPKKLNLDGEQEDNTKFEATREVVNTRVSEIVLEPRRGTYSFHDAISGAKGQIIVE